MSMVARSLDFQDGIKIETIGLSGPKVVFRIVFN